MNETLTEYELHDEAEALAHVGSFAASVDADGPARWSAECRRILGLALDAPVLSRSFFDLVHPDDREAFTSARRAAVDSGLPYELTFRIRRASDGETRWVESKARPILHGGAAAEIVGVFQDVTDKRRICEQLTQAQKMEAIGVLAGGVAHDFNNLLTVILSYTTMLAADVKPGDPMGEDLAEIGAAARRATELTRHLLAFSRQQVLEPRVVDLNETLSNQERMLKRLIGADVSLTASYAPALGKVKVDPGQIEQVIMNLVVNARDAMPGGGSLMIETSNVALDADGAERLPNLDAGPHVKISVRDTGHGMSRETLRRIFEPFFTMKPRGKGTGLGLSSSLGIVQQSGGAIAVESVLGRGATFTVYLPVTADSAAAEPTHVTGTLTLRGSETILLVEDEDQVRNIARAILRRHGYEVLEARNGGEALLICEQHPETIHAMLCDVVMPRMSGPQLAGRLRAVRPEMRVMFMSGYADGAARAEDLDAGAAFVQKPFTPATLLARLRAVLDDGPRSDGG